MASISEHGRQGQKVPTEVWQLTLVKPPVVPLSACL